MPVNFKTFVTAAICSLSLGLTLPVHSAIASDNGYNTIVKAFEAQKDTRHKLKNFKAAKKELFWIYKRFDSPATFYCSCPITLLDNRFGPADLKSCGYKVRKNAQRAQRIEAEHIMPAYNFGRQLPCWREGGRKNCKRDAKFNRMESDLHNLAPAIGEVNGDRSNFRFVDEIVKSSKNNVATYGSCPMQVEFKGKRASPPEHTHGMIARAYLYMSHKYGIKLNDNEKRMMYRWNNDNAPTALEIKRNELIKKAQGNDNPFISNYTQLKWQD